MITTDAPIGAYPPSGRRCVCGNPIPPGKRGQTRVYCSPACRQSNRRKRYLANHSQHMREYWRAYNQAHPRWRGVPAPERTLFCGCSSINHDITAATHKRGVAIYQRDLYRRTPEWQLAYMLGVRRKEAQQELPKAFYDVAVTRRRLQETARLVARWRTHGSRDDTGRSSRSPVGSDPQTRSRRDHASEGERRQQRNRQGLGKRQAPDGLPPAERKAAP